MLNFNVSPYYDDFDPSKNFHRILFKPGYAVQAREITQSQTILQNQISDFASAIYSTNTPVSGGHVTTNLQCYYVKLNSTYNNTTIKASNFLGKVVVGNTANTAQIEARVIATAEATGTAGAPGDPPTLVVAYISGPQFSDGVTLTTIDGSNFSATVQTSTSTSISTGQSSTASIANGVFYIVNGYSQASDGTKYSIGNFVNVSPQTIILDKYDNAPSYRVGLQIVEQIVDYISDPSLLDPAVGASNYQAPGADRYQITLTLTTLPLTLGNDDQFIELLRIENGSIVKQTDQTVYSAIDDYFAKRDFETNGDYIVEDFKLTPVANTINSSQYDMGISKGVAYVKGYRVENQSQITLTSDRAVTTSNIAGSETFVDYGNYFNVSGLKGDFNVTTLPQVNLHCVNTVNVAVGQGATKYNSTLVGTAFLRNLQFQQSTSGSNTGSYVFNACLSDIQTNSLGAVGNVLLNTANTIGYADSSGVFSGVANAYYGVTLTITSGTSAGDVRTITSYVASGINKLFTVNQPFTITPDASSTFTLNFKAGDTDAVVIANSNYYFTSSANVDIVTGKTNGVWTGQAILQNPGSTELIIPVGAPWVQNVYNTSYTTTKIFRSGVLSGSSGQLNLSLGSTPYKFIQGTGANFVENNFNIINTATGALLDFTTSGNTITVSSDGTTANIASTYYAGNTVDVIATVAVYNADSTSIAKVKSLVTGNNTGVNSSTGGSSGTQLNTNTYVDLNNGQVFVLNAAVTNSICLYISDIRNIVAIYDTKNISIDTPSEITNAGIIGNPLYDVTNYYTLDNGQRDTIYDFGYINQIPGAPAIKGNLLIVLNYYGHSGGDGYFTGNSYPSSDYTIIPPYTAKSSGTTYQLRDCIDFRPTRVNGQTAYTWNYTTSPTGAQSSAGIAIPKNGSYFINSYNYYLGRKDKLVLTKDNSFKIIEGIPAINPQPPAEPTGSLVIANLTLDPYTAIVGNQTVNGKSNLSVDKVIHKRWAKSDITDLEGRVNNLEYYTSLSLLEASASSTQVQDKNGLTRPNYGILVDAFNSYSTVDTYNPDFRANINIRTNRLMPAQLVENFQLQNPAVLASIGTLANTNNFAVSSLRGVGTNIFTLPYTTANLVVQALASSVVSANPFNVIVDQGIASLTPPMDNWIDNQQVVPVLTSGPTTSLNQQAFGTNLSNSGDFASIPGTSSITVTTVSGSGNTYASALSTTQVPGNTPTSLSSINGYLTNDTIQPYIRPQQIIVEAKGLLSNQNVNCWFDGVNVNQYMTTPNTIELYNVFGNYGGFQVDDVIGFYQSGSQSFHPIGRVMNVYNYPGTANTRLYISDFLRVAGNLASSQIYNGKFNSNGDYIASSWSAYGTPTNTSIVSIQTSGTISGVGGAYTPSVSGTSSGNLYHMNYNATNFSPFLNTFGVWDPTTSNTSYSASFPVVFANTGSYFMTAQCDGTATIQINGNTVISLSSNNYGPGQQTSVTFSATGNTVGNVSWTATNSDNFPSIAVVIVDSSNNMIFQSTHPVAVTYNSAGGETVMPFGGSYFTGATKVKLDPTTPSNLDYTGATINFHSKYVSQSTSLATYTPPPPTVSGGSGAGTTTIVAGSQPGPGGPGSIIIQAVSSFGVPVVTNVVSAAVHIGTAVVSGVASAVNKVASAVQTVVSNPVKAIQNLFSDRRLKRAIKYIRTLDNGIKIYSFKYLWSNQTFVGVMAQDLIGTEFESAVHKHFGFYTVDYSKLGFTMMTIEDYETTTV